jgi:hypothetical protein
METRAGVLLAEPAESLRVLSEQEFKLRATEWQPMDPEVELTLSARILELNLALAALNEAVHEVGARTLAQTLAQIDRVMEVAAGISRLDLGRVLQENAEVLPRSQPFANHADRPAGADMNLVVRHVRSLLGYCPIEHLEELAPQVGKPELGHRCRVAFDALAAFVRRNAKPQDHVTRTVGRAYTEGRLSLAEVCSVLGIGRADAIAFLESHGFCRNLDAISLSEDERDEVLDNIRKARLSGPETAPDLADRDIIATQRIEGIDARPWVRQS